MSFDPYNLRQVNTDTKPGNSDTEQSDRHGRPNNMRPNIEFKCHSSRVNLPTSTATGHVEDATDALSIYSYATTHVQQLMVALSGFVSPLRGIDHITSAAGAPLMWCVPTWCESQVQNAEGAGYLPRTERNRQYEPSMQAGHQDATASWRTDDARQVPIAVLRCYVWKSMKHVCCGASRVTSTHVLSTRCIVCRNALHCSIKPRLASLPGGRCWGTGQPNENFGKQHCQEMKTDSDASPSSIPKAEALPGGVWWSPARPSWQATHPWTERRQRQQRPQAGPQAAAARGSLCARGRRQQARPPPRRARPAAQRAPPAAPCLPLAPRSTTLGAAHRDTSTKQTAEVKKCGCNFRNALRRDKQAGASWAANETSMPDCSQGTLPGANKPSCLTLHSLYLNPATTARTQAGRSIAAEAHRGRRAAAAPARRAPLTETPAAARRRAARALSAHCPPRPPADPASTDPRLKTRPGGCAVTLAAWHTRHPQSRF